jgi:hypothetical protein
MISSKNKKQKKKDFSSESQNQFSIKNVDDDNKGKKHELSSRDSQCHD